MSTPAQKVTDWLKINPKTESGKWTSVKDAKKALGMGSDIKLKIRQGNLSTNRKDLKISKKGKSLDADKNRRRWIKQSTPPLTKEELVIKKKKYAEAKNDPNKVIDHIDDTSLTGKMVDDIMELVKKGKISMEEAKKILDRLLKRKGDHPDNLDVIAKGQNGDKAVDTGKVQKKLKEKEEQQPSTTPDADRWKELISAFQKGKAIQKLGSTALKIGKPIIQGYMASRMLR